MLPLNKIMAITNNQIGILFIPNSADRPMPTASTVNKMVDIDFILTPFIVRDDKLLFMLFKG